MRNSRMLYPLNVISHLDEEKYGGFIKSLDTIMQADYCAINKQGTCIDYRAGNRKDKGKTCCIKPTSKTACTQLGPSGCLTRNLACKTYFCKTVRNLLSQESQNTIQHIRGIIHSTLEKDENVIFDLYFEDEKTVREFLSITP